MCMISNIYIYICIYFLLANMAIPSLNPYSWALNPCRAASTVKCCKLSRLHSIHPSWILNYRKLSRLHRGPRRDQ